MFRATVFTLMPDMFPGPLGVSLSGDALARGLNRYRSELLAALNVSRLYAQLDELGGSMDRLRSPLALPAPCTATFTAADQNLVLAPPPLMRVNTGLLSLKCDAWDEVEKILTSHNSP